MRKGGPLHLKHFTVCSPLCDVHVCSMSTQVGKQHSMPSGMSLVVVVVMG